MAGVQRVAIKTTSRVQFVDITARVQEVLTASGVTSGVCHVFVPHTTAGITLNEHADPSVVADIAAKLEELVSEYAKYRHTEGNAHAHIRASLVGSSETIIIDGGRLVLGTWQGVFLCEFDGPRERSVLIKVVADRP